MSFTLKRKDEKTYLVIREPVDPTALFGSPEGEEVTVELLQSRIAEAQEILDAINNFEG